LLRAIGIITITITIIGKQKEGKLLKMYADLLSLVGRLNRLKASENQIARAL
jgi:hypothetical protein